MHALFARGIKRNTGAFHGVVHGVPIILLSCTMLRRDI
jgi:hypothetical protein